MLRTKGELTGITGAPVEEQETRGSRRATIAAWLLIFAATSAIGLSRFIAVQTDFETMMIFYILSICGFFAGFLILTKYGRRKAFRGEGIKYPIKTLAAGMGLLILGLLAILVVVTLVPYEERALPFFFSIGLMIAGAFVSGIASVTAQMRATGSRFAVPSQIMDSFRQIDPDKSFETKNFFVLRKEDIHILLPKMFNCAFFVKSFKQTPNPMSKLKLPLRLFRRKYFKDEIGGLPVARLEGEYSIPVDTMKRGDATFQVKYAKILGVAYVVPRFDVVHRGLFKTEDLSRRFDRVTILEIIGRLSKETLEREHRQK